MKIKPLANYRLLGTEIRLSTRKTYTATPATNQPDWEARGLIHVSERAHDPVGMILQRGEYKIVTP